MKILILRPLIAATLLFSPLSGFAQIDRHVDPTIFQDRSSYGEADSVVMVLDSSRDVSTVVKPAFVIDSAMKRDLMLKEVVWREIDTREAQNMAFRYPGDEQSGGGYFIEVLIRAIKEGQVLAYASLEDSFSTPLQTDEVMQMVHSGNDSVQVFDLGKKKKARIVVTPKAFDPDVVTKYRLKEHWLVDYNTGNIFPEIVGIAPMIEVRDTATDEVLGQAPWFWLSYADSREMLAGHEVFQEGDAPRTTWVEFFEARYFKSYIVKDNQPFSEPKAEGTTGTMEALYSTGSRCEMIFNKESDMWVY